jgi:spermidine synthase
VDGLPETIARWTGPRGEVVLRRRDSGAGEVEELIVNGAFAMDSIETGSERALAALARPGAQVLVGGLGLGFTTEALLKARVGSVDVVEIEEALVGWMRDGTIAHGKTLLADQRANVVVADVSLALAEAREASYDLVLLDVDNGPGYLVHDGNAALYEAPFLRLTRRILRPGGALAIWSAAEATSLEATLREVYDEVEPLTYAVVLQRREVTYWLYVARATSS